MVFAAFYLFVLMMFSKRVVAFKAFLLIISSRWYGGLAKEAAKYCVDNEYTDGKWVYNNDSALNKNFICCQSTNNDYMQPICVPNLERKGFVGSSEGYMLFHDDVCSCDREEGTRFKISKRERYQWKPSTCTLLEWDATQFCDLLGNRKILFLGDSSNGHSAITLINMINDANEICSENIRFISTPLLEPSVLTPTDIADLKKDFPDFVIASAGHHFHEDSGKEDFNAAFDLFVSTLVDIHSQFVAHTKAAKQRKFHFIWKSINPPHIHCNKYPEPTTERVPFLHSMDPLCKWDWFDSYDDHARNATVGTATATTSSTVSTAPQMLYLDMSPLLYRPDAHPRDDCLHYCAPGPLDLFPRLLLQRLYGLESSANSGKV